jgi:dephospho-CoA kinase
MLVVGLTGGISSGKSTVLKIFRKLGSRTIDADKIAHKLTKSNTRVLQEIVRKFGPEVLNRNGILNRKRLADIIFKDRGKREQLNAIMHPRIIAEIKKRIREIQKLIKPSEVRGCGRNRNILVVDIPLLFEAKLQFLVDKIVLVYVLQKIQIERLRRDNSLTLKKARARLDAQIPLYKKKEYADYIINGDLNSVSLQRQVELVWKDLLSLCQ